MSEDAPPGGILLLGRLPAGARLAVGRFDAYPSGAPPPPLPAAPLRLRRLPAARSSYGGSSAAVLASIAAAADASRGLELAPASAAASAARSGGAAPAAAGTFIGTRETLAGHYCASASAASALRALRHRVTAFYFFQRARARPPTHPRPPRRPPALPPQWP